MMDGSQGRVLGVREEYSKIALQKDGLLRHQEQAMTLTQGSKTGCGDSLSSPR